MKVGIGATIASEWTKLATLRSTWITLGIGIVASIVLSGLVDWGIAVVWDEMSPQERMDFIPAISVAPGMLVFGIIALVLAVRTATAEYASGMIRTTLVVTPRRGRVLAAKLIVVSAVLAVATAVAQFGSLFVANLVFSGFDIPIDGMFSGDAWDFYLVSIITAPVFPIFAMSLGFVLRSTAGAITAVLAMIFLPLIAMGLIPERFDGFLDYLPSAVLDSVQMGRIDPLADYLDLPLALVLLAGWLVVFVGGAWLRLTRSDA